MRVLLTTTSYQDTPGRHHQLLEESGFDLLKARGPLDESMMLELVCDGEIDGILHGDDQITRRVLEAARPRLKVLSKYGIGLDSIDVDAATKMDIAVLFTPGVNHTTVAEHTFGLLIMLAKHLQKQINSVNKGRWDRLTGIELAGKTMGVLGMGRIGKEVAKRAMACEMKVLAYDIVWDETFATEHRVERCLNPEDILRRCDVVSLHMNLTDANRRFINKQSLAMMKDGAILLNCSRGGLIDETAVAEACRNGKLWGYGADVLEIEPIRNPHPFQEIDNILITPHIASRTFQSVERQAIRATLNLVNYLNGNDDYIQANKG